MSTLGIGTRADRFANKIQGRGKCNAWLTFRRGPGPNIVRWVYHLFLGLHGPLTPPWIRKGPPDRQLLGTSYFKRDVGFGSIGASGKQNRVRVRFPRPQTNNKTPLNRTFHHSGLPTYTPSGQDERQGKIEKLIKLPVMASNQKEGSTPTPAPGNRTRGLPLRPLRGILTETQASQPIISNHES